MRKEKRPGHLLLVFCLVLFVCGLTQCRKESPKKGIDEPVLKTNVYKWSNGGVLPDSALADIDEFARQVSEISIPESDRLNYMNHYRDMAAALKARYTYYRDRGNFAEAYKNIQEYLKISKIPGDSFLVKDAIYVNGRYLFMQGYYWDALDYFLQLTDMDLPANEKIILYYTLGQVYYSIYDQTNEHTPFYYNLAKEEMKKPDFTQTELKGFVLFGEGGLYANMDDAHLYGDYTVSPSLADSLRTSIRLHEEAAQYYDYPGNFCSAALSYAILGDMTHSRLAEQKAFELLEKHPESLSTVLYVSALIRYREKKYDEAIAIARKGLAESEANDKKSDMEKNAKVLYHSYEATGDFTNACKYLQMGYLLQEHKVEEEKKSQLVMAQIKYDTKLKEEELQKERERNRINSLKIRYISGGLFLLLVALVVYIQLYRQKQKAYRSLVQKNLQWAETSFVQDAAVPPVEEEEKEEEEKEEEEPAAAAKSDVTFDMEGQYLLMQKVYELLEREKLYMNTDLSLELLARHVNTNVKYLSQAINNISHANFKTFINQYRIKEAILLTKDMPSGQSFDEIADLCGFSDRSTFYRSFKKETGFTPLKFKRILD
ncbi:hypothetical protein FACS1894177_04780 [Bacteroidia bacterium]|nr:hypothetical protein FACS1894177_04780 [Bacteroidia bacterium]